MNITLSYRYCWLLLGLAACLGPEDPLLRIDLDVLPAVQGRLQHLGRQGGHCAGEPALRLIRSCGCMLCDDPSGHYQDPDRDAGSVGRTQTVHGHDALLGNGIQRIFYI